MRHVKSGYQTSGTCRALPDGGVVYAIRFRPLLLEKGLPFRGMVRIGYYLGIETL